VTSAAEAIGAVAARPTPNTKPTTWRETTIRFSFPR
jgi:hypothetical protein